MGDFTDSFALVGVACGKPGGRTNKRDVLTLCGGSKIPNLFRSSHKTLRLNICNPQGTGRSLPSLGCCVCNRVSDQILRASTTAHPTSSVPTLGTSCLLRWPIARQAVSIFRFSLLSKSAGLCISKSLAAHLPFCVRPSFAISNGNGCS